jgi:hypothetical protein
MGGRCACKYEGDDVRKPVALLAKGSDGLAGLHAQFSPTAILYALLRKVRLPRCAESLADPRAATHPWGWPSTTLFLCACAHACVFLCVCVNAHDFISAADGCD